MKISNIITGKYLETDSFKKRFWIIITITIIAILYMFSKFQSHGIYRELTSIKSELSTIRAKHSTIHAERIRVTREVYLLNMLDKHKAKLHKNEDPPIKLD